MAEVSELGLNEEEIELDLGLSIGRNFGKPENPKQQPDLKPNEFDPGMNEQHQNQALSGIACEQQREGAAMDPKVKREIHALRRQEAKKKRELKRAMRESEPDNQRVPKREKTDHPNGGTEFRNVMNLNLSNEQDTGRASASGPTVSFRTSCEQVVGSTRGGGLTATFPMAQVQYVALNNGFALPCVVPCWARSVNENEKNIVGQNGVACRGFQPYNGSGLEQNAEGDRKAKSNGSSMCSSSVISENRSSSQEGGGSTDSRSHSAHSSANPTQLNSFKENNIARQTEQSASSHPIVSRNGNLTKTNHIVKDLQQNMTRPNSNKLKATTNHIVKDLQQNILQPNSSKPKATTESKSSPIDKPSSKENPCTMPLKETKTDAGKPPKPLSQSPLLPQMPYVSTTGNGPNGKTVNGFLYRYTKSEVSIVCVCHGSTFSPAEFVQHAGGTDISQPLRHITVIPAAFG